MYIKTHHLLMLDHIRKDLRALILNATNNKRDNGTLPKILTQFIIYLLCNKTLELQEQNAKKFH